jgi:hypothetical protein
MFIAQLEGGRCPVKLANPRSMGALAAVVGGALWMAEGLRYLTDPVPIINWGSTYVGVVVFGFGFLVTLVGLGLLLRDFLGMK